MIEIIWMKLTNHHSFMLKFMIGWTFSYSNISKPRHHPCSINTILAHSLISQLLRSLSLLCVSVRSYSYFPKPVSATFSTLRSHISKTQHDIRTLKHISLIQTRFLSWSFSSSHFSLFSGFRFLYSSKWVRMNIYTWIYLFNDFHFCWFLFHSVNFLLVTAGHELNSDIVLGLVILIITLIALFRFSLPLLLQMGENESIYLNISF